MDKMIPYIIVLVIIVAIAIFATRSDIFDVGSGTGQPAATTGAEEAVAVTPDLSGLKIEDIKVGTGAEAKNGDQVTVNYVGTLADGKKFDSSYDRKEPFKFSLGAGEVIKGWDFGVLGMKVGGKRKLTIPPVLGYGDQPVGNGLIPANSTLVFEVELLAVSTSSPTVATSTPAK